MGKKANAINKVTKAIDASADASSNSVKGALKSLIVACDSTATPTGDSVPGLIEQVADVVPSGGGGGGSLGSPVQVQIQALDTDDTPYWTNLYASRLYVYADAIGDTVPLPPDELPSFEVGNIDVFTAPVGLGVVVLISASNLSAYGRHVQVLIDDETQPVTFITQEVPQMFNPDVKDLAVAFTMPEVTNGTVLLRIDNE